MEEQERTTPASTLGTLAHDGALEAEWNTYCKEVMRLLAEGAEGKYVFIKDHFCRRAL
jgi:hypothetical protein